MLLLRKRVYIVAFVDGKSSVCVTRQLAFGHGRMLMFFVGKTNADFKTSLHRDGSEAEKDEKFQ